MNDYRSLRALKDEYKTEFATYVLESPEFTDLVNRLADDFIVSRIKLCADYDSRHAMKALLKDVISDGDF